MSPDEPRGAAAVLLDAPDGIERDAARAVLLLANLINVGTLDEIPR